MEAQMTTQTDLIKILQRAAHVMAEVPNEHQTPQFIAVRNQVVQAIKTTTPEYYGLPRNGAAA
jgi:hypothetical protein